MSIKIMTRVWDNGPDNQGELLVLLALADFADDAGNCWPSLATIAKKARIQERSARRIVRRLEDAGYLQTVVGGGRHGCNQYRVNPDIKSPRTESPPDRDAPKTRTLTTQNPDPSVPRTVIEPPIEPSESNNARAILDVLCQWASEEAARSFVAYRRKQKGKALTLTASKRMASQLEQIAQRGGDVDDALGMAEERGWQSVQADWYFNAKQPKGQTHGKRDGEAAERARRAGERAAARAMDFGEGGDALGPLFPAGQPVRSIGSGD